MRYCLLLLLLLCGSCTSGNQSSNANLIYSDTTYFQRLDTSFISANLTPKYALNRLNVVIPFLPLDTNLPVKNKAGKTIGKAKIKMEQNSEGSIDFDAEIEQDIDSVPKVTNFVKVEAPAKEKGFWEQLGGYFLTFSKILMIGLFVFLLVIAIKWYLKYRSSKE